MGHVLTRLSFSRIELNPSLMYGVDIVFFPLDCIAANVCVFLVICTVWRGQDEPTDDDL